MKRKFEVQYYERVRKNILKPLEVCNRKYILFPNDDAVTASLIQGWNYEGYIFHFINDNLIDLDGTDIIDVGANNGNFTIEFADLVGDNGRVFSFEPQRIIYQQLCGNVFANGLDNVYAYNVAIGHENGTVFVENVDYHNSGYVNFGNVHVVSSDESKQSVPIIKLDSLEYQNLSIIKIDVQGFESYVIKGALETIKKHRPFIFIEIENDQLKNYGFTEQNIVDEIQVLGYTVKRFQEGIPYESVGGYCLDCVCIPKEKLNDYSFRVR